MLDREQQSQNAGETDASSKGMPNLADREHVIVRTSIIGIIANIFLAGFKAAVGWVTGSIAVVLDAVNNLTDALSSVITILGAKLGNRKPDRKHPLGHGRYEYLSAMVIAGIVLYAGITSLIESIKKVINPEASEYTVVSLVIIAAAVVVKLILGRYVQAKGKQVNSGALVASGKDAFFDAILSASVFAAAIIYLLTGISLEAFVGIAISIVIAKAGIEMLRDALDDILGHRPDPELSRAIKQTVIEDPAVIGAYDLIIETYGPGLVVAFIHVEVVDTMTAIEIDEMTRRLQKAVAERHGIALATVGVYAQNTKSAAVAAMRESIADHVLNHDGVLQMHGFFVNEEEHFMTFDIVLDFAVPDRQQLFDQIVSEVKEMYPDYDVAATLDRDLSD